jgi:2,4-dienoyl-CoA reductase-like NADH-dependent reductase (Old Yellow Enzyme family)
MKLFEPVTLGTCQMKNRIMRSATYEGLCDISGTPTAAYTEQYGDLAKNNIGGMITGFAFVSKDGKAMQPGQAGMDSDDKINAYKKVTDRVHEYGGKIFMQLAHAGRQTSKEAAGGRVYGASTRKSAYFNVKPGKMSRDEINRVIENFADAARRAQDAGFDGVQVHAAHGYLHHQFILPAVNNRDDIFGINPQGKIGIRFLEKTIDLIRERCGNNFPLLVKISAGDDYREKFSEEHFIHLVQFLAKKKVDGIEISYGTMDHALNIFRGDSFPSKQIIRYNPKYKSTHALYIYLWKHYIGPYVAGKFKPFTPAYNLGYAQLAKKYTDIPIICVGGFRNGREMEMAVEKGYTDIVSLCRAFICEPDFATRIATDNSYQSGCKNCNRCAIMCDSPFPTKCYQRKEKS